MMSTLTIDPDPAVDYLEVVEARARALGWKGIGFTQHPDGMWVAIALKDVAYGVVLPTASGPTRERAAASLLRALHPGRLSPPEC